MILTSGYGDRRKLPSVLYHIAYREDLRSIKRHGLLKSLDDILNDDTLAARPGVNMVADFENWPPWTMTKRDIIVAVNTQHLNKKKFTLLGDWWFRYHDNIPPSALTIFYP